MSDDITPSDKGADGGSVPSRTHSLKERAIEEMRKFLVIFLYLWVLFGLFTLYQAVILSERNISFSAHGLAFVNALVFSKVMLVAEDLHIASGMKDKPLAYPIIYRSIVFAVVFICVHLLEKLAGGLLVGEKVSQIFPALEGGATFGWRSVGETVSIAAITVIALVPYFAYRELGRVIGEERLFTLFFKSRAKDPTSNDTRMDHPSRS